jgi:CMP-N-acetylneuraminic acid synthetase
MKIGIDNHYIQTHSTSPFLSVNTIKKAVSSYQSGIESGTFDSLFSVNALQTRLYTRTLQPINHNPSNLVRTQDLSTIYEENSAFYCFSGKSFQSNLHRIGQKPNVFIMARNSIESIDVDDMDDWRFAENVYKVNTFQND